MARTTSTVNLVMQQGTDFSVTFDILDDDGLPMDLTLHTATAQMRPHHDSNTAYPFACVTFNGGVTLTMNATVNSAIEARRYVYDVRLTGPALDNTKPIKGRVRLDPAATRS